MKTFKEFIENKKELFGLLDPKGIHKEIFDFVEVLGEFNKKYSNGDYCKSKKVKINKSLIPKVKKLTKEGYFSIIYDKKIVFVIFQHKSFKISRKDFGVENKMKNIIKYASDLNIDKIYFLETKLPND